MPMLTTLRMRLPLCPSQAPLRTRSAKSAMRSSTCVHLGHDVDAVDTDVGTARRAQRHVQHRAVLGAVDALAGEHGVDALAQAGLVGQRQQQAQRLVGDALLGIVQVDAGGLQRQAFAALGIGGEQLAQMQRFQAPGRGPAAPSSWGWR